MTASVTGGGLSWSNEPSEQALARNALSLLEDRRVLYEPFQVEIPRHCVSSVREIREELRPRIEQCRSAALRDPLRAIQAATREFLTQADKIEGSSRTGIDIHSGGTPSWLFNQELGVLRALVGINVALIVERFDLDIDEHLARILPPLVDLGARELRLRRLCCDDYIVNVVLSIRNN